MLFHIIFLPALLLISATLIAFPLSRYMTWIVNGQYNPPKFLQWFEEKLSSGPQNWKEYLSSLLFFSLVLFVFGYIILSLQPWMPLNPEEKTLLAPNTIFHSAASFMTNTNLQHYSGEIHLSNFSQIFFCIPQLFLSASIGLNGLAAIIKALRGDVLIGNFYLDIWRSVFYIFMPIAFIIAVILVQQGSPMTFASLAQVEPLQQASMGLAENGDPLLQKIVLGPVAAFESIKMLGTSGGGFYNMNAAHPFENPTAFSNVIVMLSMMLLPFAAVLMYGRMLGYFRHSLVIFTTMLLLLSASIGWSIYFDTCQPNPGFSSQFAKIYQITSTTGNVREVKISSVEELPIDQHLGNLEGKEIRFGTSAGATYSAITTSVTCGAINAEADSLNPLASLSPLMGMWLNCIFGGKGIGMINMLLFIIIAIFIAGMMVGRTPEYLGKKIGGHEAKLAIVTLLLHPLMILIPSGLFAATNWGVNAVSNPGAHGLSQILYQFSSAAANNGSAFNGLLTTYGFYNNPHPNSEAFVWDIATGLIMIFSRFLPIIAATALAASLGAKKSSPFGSGTLRNDTATFGFLLLGTILIIGALLFFPVAALGPIAEHLGPMPFSG